MKSFLLAALTFPWRLLGWLRTAVANLLLLGLLGVGIAALIGHEEESALPDNAVLYIELGETLVEQHSYSDPLTSLMQASDNTTKETVLHEVTSAIRWAATDDSIRAIVLDADNLQGSDLGKLESIAQAIAAFKESDKPVIAVGDNFSQSQYYIASMADTIYLNPMGAVQLEGFSAYQSYLKTLLDQLAVNVHVFRAGEFKSFVEPFVRNDMSPEARENLQQWMDEQWLFYARAIEQRRQLKKNDIDTYINTQDLLLANHKNNPAEMAKAFGLVDELATRTDITRIVDELTKDSPANRVDATTYYHNQLRKQEASALLEDQPKIAIIQASGPIMDGYQPSGYVGAETLIEQIHDARDDDDVVALVLRIDSPGGSAFASELIRSELAACQAAGKPVVASMGGVAASGGYWIAASANEIWASPASITGSIGVFGVIPTFENSFAKLGIFSDGYSTAPLAETLDMGRPLSPLATRVIQQGVDFTYQEFLRLVAAGRKSSPDAIDHIAQGRVWTGAHAQKIHLVDELGELEDAIAAAAKLAKITTYRADFMEPALSPLETFLQNMEAQSLLRSSTFSSNSWGTLVSLLQQVMNLDAVQQLHILNDPNHRYVKCWECGYRIN